MSLTHSVPNNSLFIDHMAYTLHVSPRRSMSLVSWDDLFLQGLKWPLNLCCILYRQESRQNNNRNPVALKTGFRKCSFKWARHLIWDLFLQVTTPAVWIMGAAVPSALPSQEAECVPALTTSFWRRTMSHVQVGGHNESDKARGLRSSCPSIV